MGHPYRSVGPNVLVDASISQAPENANTGETKARRERKCLLPVEKEVKVQLMGEGGKGASEASDRGIGVALGRSPEGKRAEPQRSELP